MCSMFSNMINNASSRKLPLCICIEDSKYIDKLNADEIIKEIRGFLKDMKNDPEISRCADIYFCVFSNRTSVLTDGFKPISELNTNNLWTETVLESEEVCLCKCLNETFFELCKQQKHYESSRQNTYKPVIMLLGSGHAEKNTSVNEELISQVESEMIVMQPIIISRPANSDPSNYRIFVKDEQELSGFKHNTSREEILNYFHDIFNSINQMSRSTAGIYEKPIRNTEERWRELK